MTSNHYNYHMLKHHLKNEHVIYNMMEHLETILVKYKVPIDPVAFHQALTYFKGTELGAVVLRYDSNEDIHRDLNDHEELYPALLKWHEAWAGNTSTIAHAYEALWIVRSHHQAQELHSTTSSSTKAARGIL